MARTLFHLNASARSQGSVSRDLSQKLVDQLSDGQTHIISRDVGASPLPLVSESWVGANFTPEEARTPEQKDVLALSDTLIAELEAADTLVFGVPIYNFGVPAAFKAWIDLVARARKTFKYTETGPVGLLEGKTAYVCHRLRRDGLWLRDRFRDAVCAPCSRFSRDSRRHRDRRRSADVDGR